MKSIVNIFVLTGLVLNLTACGQDSESANETVKERVVYNVNGLPAEEFYSKFIAQISGTCEQRDIAYRYPSSRQFRIERNDNGYETFGELTVVMKADKTYRALYRELDKLNFFFGQFVVAIRERVINGAWRVVEDCLDLENLGVAIGFNNGEGPALKLNFGSKLVSPKINGRTTELVNTGTRHTPFPDMNPCSL